MKRGKTPVEAEAEHLMKSHAMFCLRRAKAFSSLVDANKFQAMQEELGRLKASANAIFADDKDIPLSSETLRHVGLLAINAAAAVGVLQAAIANISKNTKNAIEAVEQKAEP